MEGSYYFFGDTPLIRRARGYFLYTAESRRFLDFYQDNGRAVLGHRPEGMQRVFKSTAGKGLFAPYPSVYAGRIEKMTKKIFPEAVSVRVYRSKERLYSILPSEVKDPLLGEEGDVTIWRPFMGMPENFSDIIIPVLPFPGGFGLQVAVICNEKVKLPPSDIVSPFLSDAMVKVISSLEKELLYYTEEDLSVFDSSLWRRHGRYLVFKPEVFGNSRDEYHDFYKKALDAGIFLPPGQEYPAIIPLEYEIAHVKKFLKIF